MAQFEHSPGDRSGSRDTRNQRDRNRDRGRDLSYTRNVSNVPHAQIAERQAQQQRQFSGTGGNIGKVVGALAMPGIGAPIGQALGSIAGKVAAGPVTGYAPGYEPGGQFNPRGTLSAAQSSMAYGSGPGGSAGGQFAQDRGTGGAMSNQFGVTSGATGPAALQAGTSGLGGGIGGATDAQTMAQQQAIEEQRRQQALISGQLSPYQTAGQQALAQQQALLGMGGQEAQQQAFAAFAETPGQQYLRERQEKALMRNAAAMGGLGGGNVRTALQEQAAGIAAQDYANQFGRLGQLSGQGLQATTAGGQFGAGTSANIANLLTGQGEARATGIIAKEQAKAAKTEGIANILGMYAEPITDVATDIFGGIGSAISDYF